MSSEQVNLYLIYMNAMIREISNKIGLSLSQYYALQCIHADGITMSELSKVLGIDNSTLTRNINKLIERDLVVKYQSNIDKREYIISLTKEGDLTNSRIDSSMQDIIDEVINDIDNNSKNIFINTIEKINWKLHCMINEL